MQSPLFDEVSISVKTLTLKRVFLLSLALVKRRSELHSLKRATVCVNTNPESVTLHPYSKCLSKTYISCKGVGALRAVTVPALPQSTVNALLTLCPVLMLKRYIEVINGFRSPGH